MTPRVSLMKSSTHFDKKKIMPNVCIKIGQLFLM